MGSSEKRCCLAWGLDRADVERFLISGAKIVDEYIKDGADSYLAIIECAAPDATYGWMAQARRLDLNEKGSPLVYFHHEAQSTVKAFFGAVKPFADAAPGGPRSRLSALGA